MVYMFMRFVYLCFVRFFCESPTRSGCKCGLENEIGNEGHEEHEPSSRWEDSVPIFNVLCVVKLNIGGMCQLFLNCEEL